MTDKPILFSGPMVCAILDGRKRQTRRVLKPQPPSELDIIRGPDEAGRYHWTNGLQWQFWPGGLNSPEDDYMPPYAPGDRLWVREAWGHDAPDLETCRSRLEDALPGGITYGPYYMADADWASNHTIKKRPSIHMPRWASRLTLTVTDVRVERVQDIGAPDVIAEGYPDEPSVCLVAERQWFRELWDSLNAKRGHGWEANPWVCATTFTAEHRNIDGGQP